MEEKLTIINTYLKAIADLNSVYTYSDFYYVYGIVEIFDKELFISEKISIFDDYEYQKLYKYDDKKERQFIGNVVEIRNWENELTNTCNEWFYRGAHILNLRVLSLEKYIEYSKDVKEKVQETIQNRAFPTKKLLVMLKDFFENRLINVYRYSTIKLHIKENASVIDEYIFVCKDKAYTLNFDIMDGTKVLYNMRIGRPVRVWSL